MPESENNPVPSGAAWTFLTNHSHVLACLARDPAARVRDIAVLVGITERAVQRIVADLEEGGVITRQRAGRRNQYEIHSERPLRHAIEAHCTVGDLLGVVAPTVGSPLSPGCGRVDVLLKATDAAAIVDNECNRVPES